MKLSISETFDIRHETLAQNFDQFPFTSTIVIVSSSSGSSCFTHEINSAVFVLPGKPLLTSSRDVLTSSARLFMILAL